MTAANRIAIVFILGYQKTLGVFMPGRCRFYPTCSAYALQCFESYSFFTALWKSMYRILRCNPLSTGYFDPAVSESAIGHNHMHKE